VLYVLEKESLTLETAKVDLKYGNNDQITWLERVVVNLELPDFNELHSLLAVTAGVVAGIELLYTSAQNFKLWEHFRHLCQDPPGSVTIFASINLSSCSDDSSATNYSERTLR
jgi:hypothetical protein